MAVNLVDGFFERNLTLQDDFRTFQDDLSEGRFLPSFIERAANARKRRLQGEFDKWKVIRIKGTLNDCRIISTSSGGDKIKNWLLECLLATLHDSSWQTWQGAGCFSKAMFGFIAELSKGV